MNPILNKTVLGFTVALALLTGTACSEETTYSYFTIKLSLDPALEPELLARVTACALVVTGSDEDQINVPCVGNNGKVLPNLPAADFSTSETSGQLQFILNVIGFENGGSRDSQKLLAQGKSPRYGIVPNGQTAASVEAKKIDTGVNADVGTTATTDAGSL